MKTIKEAHAKGCRVYRQIRYFAESKDGITYELIPEAKYETLPNWKKWTGQKKCKKKKT